MGKKLAEYWFLLVAVLSLAVGLVLRSFGAAESGFLSTPADGAFAVGAAVGLVLSVRWLVLAIREREFGSDALAVLSIAATAVTNEWLAASVIALMLATGRALETWAAGRARAQLEALLARAPQRAHLILKSGETLDVPLDQVSIGDSLLVRSGEVVPIDGVLVGDATFDESALTGEPLPRYRAVGEEVSSGVLNSGGTVELTAIRTAADSTYSNLIRLVEQAQASSARGVRLANKWAVRFVPFAIGLSLLAWAITGDYSRAVAVIVAATPCPLILAVPVALIAGMSKASANGVIIKGGAALEFLARTKTVLLDKTGTLTHGGPEIAEIRFAPSLDAGRDQDAVLAAAASLEQSSPHVVAKAIIAAAKVRGLALSRAESVVEEHGVGLTGVVGGRKLRVGQPVGELPAWAQLPQALLVAIEVDGKLLAMIGLDDPVREESRSTISGLRELGVTRIALISGDRKSTADAVGAEVGVDVVHSECTPEQKLRIVEAEMAAVGKAGGSVLAVGDGINDAPALAMATVGVAMGARGATAASEAADVVIVEDSISHLWSAIAIAKGARARALQAAGVGMALSVVAMFLGAFGVFSATGGAIAQEAIDAAAILWALVPSNLQRNIQAQSK